MVLHDLLRDRKTQSGAVLLAVADERLKQLVTKRGFYSGTIVGGADFQVAIDLSHVYRDVAAANLGSLAAIQQQIVEDTLHFPRIELRAVQPRRFNADQDLVELGMRLHELNGAADDPLDGSFAEVQRIGGTRQLQQRMDQIGQPVHCNPDLLIKLFALLPAQIDR